MKLRVYLDTSVFSAYYDERVTDRQAETEAFWTRLQEFEISTSELARDELAQTPDAAQRTKFQQLLTGSVVHPITEDMTRLARRYIEDGAFTALMWSDALHVAVAS